MVFVDPYLFQSLSISERCDYNRIINYTVFLVSSAGEMVDQGIVRSDSCSGGLCSTSFSPSSSDLTYHVSISATNVFGESNSTSSITFSKNSNKIILYIVYETLILSTYL